MGLSSKIKLRTVCLLVVFLSLTAGCSSMLVSSSAPPIYYQLEYTPAEVTCSREFHQGLRVWDFTTLSPFNRPQMVVIKERGQVLYSNAYQWVANPGVMVAQCLLRDLNRGALFSQAVSADSPVTVPLELTGQVFVFAWDKNGSEVKARLQVQATLVGNANPGKILFRQNYSLQSDPFKENTAADFAKAMSRLVDDFSRKLRRDLCDSLSGHGS